VARPIVHSPCCHQHAQCSVQRTVQRHSEHSSKGMPSCAWPSPSTLLFHQGTLEVIHPCRWFSPIVPGMMICQQGCHLAPCGTVRRHAARLDGCDAREDNRHAQQASSAPLRTSPSCGVWGYTRWSLSAHPPYCLWPVLLSVGQERTLPSIAMAQGRVSTPHMAQHLRRLRARPLAPLGRGSDDISGPFIRIRQRSCIRIWLQARERSPEL
jgi:hypothetical protein